MRILTFGFYGLDAEACVRFKNLFAQKTRRIWNFANSAWSAPQLCVICCSSTLLSLIIATWRTANERRELRGPPYRLMPTFLWLHWAEVMADETKIIYHIDDEETPYLVKISKGPKDVTLGDFKNILNRPSYKFFFKSMDDDFGWAFRESTCIWFMARMFGCLVKVWLQKMQIFWSEQPRLSFPVCYHYSKEEVWQYSPFGAL